MRIGSFPETLFDWAVSILGAVPTPLLDTFQAALRARVIMAGTQLGVFEALKSEPRTAAEVSRQLGTDARGTEKLLNALVGAGYLRFGNSRYRLRRPARKWLLKESPISLHDNMLFRYLEWKGIEHFEEFVRTGRHMKAHETLGDDEWRTYQLGMRSLAGLSAWEVAGRMPVPVGAERMLDIGGSHGLYSVALCRKHPLLSSTILDLPEALRFALPILEQERMGERVATLAGDALRADLGTGRWDLVFLSQLVHHFDEAANLGLMERIARSLRPGGVVAVLEILRPPSPDSAGQTGALLDLFFAVTSRSGSWSAGEIAQWQARAGLEPRRTIRLRTVPGAGIQPAVKASS